MYVMLYIVLAYLMVLAAFSNSVKKKYNSCIALQWLVLMSRIASDIIL